MAGRSKSSSAIKARSLDEIRVRGAQALSVLFERCGLSPYTKNSNDVDFVSRALDTAWSRGLRGGTEHLLEHFRQREAPRFFEGLGQRDRLLAELRARWPDAERETIRRAERIRIHRFDLLGRSGLDFGSPIDWHLDPTSSKRSPRRHWSQIAYLDPEEVGDHKVIWELNRHQHLISLGKAYWYTGDERYAESFVEQLDSWWSANPPKLGINWASSLEVSFRAISWIWALHFFRLSDHLTPSVFMRALRFLYLHGRHLESYLSTYFSPNTHLTGEALGLFYLGTAFPEFRKARRWRDIGKRTLEEQITNHVRRDGSYFEQSTYYHLYTVEFYLHLLILSERNGLALSVDLKKRLEAALDHLMAITRPDGLLPLFGDDDGGRLLDLGEREPNDPRPALATGAVLYSRSDFAHVAGSAAEDTGWLLGVRALHDFDLLPKAEPGNGSRAFRDGGYYVMRDGWSDCSSYMLISCGPHGSLGGGHAHADALAFECAASGLPVIVDPGTYTYTTSMPLRDRFRSSHLHNTVSVDGESSSVPGGFFSWKHAAQCHLDRWISDERFDCFEGWHDGYERLAYPAKHRRGIFFIKGDFWAIKDQIESAGEHEADLRFAFAPSQKLILEANVARASCRSGTLPAGVDVHLFGPAGTICDQEAEVSTSYGAISPAPAITYSARVERGRPFVSLLFPWRGSRPKRTVEEIDADGGWLFRWRGAESRDLLVVAAGGESECEEIATDFNWVWIRESTDGATLHEFTLISGSYLRLAGRDLFSSPEPVGYIAASRRGDKLIVRSDAMGAVNLAPRGAEVIAFNGNVARVRGALDGKLLEFDAKSPRAR